MGYVESIRKYVGHKPIFFCGCGVLIFNQKGEVLLQKRSDDGLWGNPGGAMELGETIYDTIIRETKEETGHNCHLIDERERAILHYINARNEKVESHFYLAIDDGLTNEKIDEEDKEVSIWKNYKEVERLLEFQILKDFWNKIKKEIENIIDMDKEMDDR